ncbi:alkylated DNA repair protein AlkB [Pseudomonas ogarae]|nr:alkylated DNA repair protein AlkB [Pseudomonas ogarae]
MAGAVVSRALELPAVFRLGGFGRRGKSLRIPVCHGDIVVWGGVDRVRYHGVLPRKEGQHPRLGAQRLHLTFRTPG